MSNIERSRQIPSWGDGMRRGAAALTLGMAGLAAAADEAPAVDKSQFTLFRPTPTALLRELATDRPDMTESPITVDAGHFLLEVSFVDYTHNRSQGVRTDQIIAAPFNLKLGLLNRVDLEIVLNPCVQVRTRTNGAATGTVTGFGDALIRVKINLWGNDGPQAGFGKTAFGLLPFIKIPTARGGLGNGRVEGGLILPLAVDLPAGFDLGMMVEFDFVRNDPNTRYGLETVHSITLGHPLIGSLRGYVEYVGITPNGTGTSYRGFFSTGLIYAVGKDVQLDAGTRVGLSKRSDALNLFTGISLRF